MLLQAEVVSCECKKHYKATEILSQLPLLEIHILVIPSELCHSKLVEHGHFKNPDNRYKYWMYNNSNLQIGLWLSEFTHIYRAAKENGYEITIASPSGVNVPVDPIS